jgi:hypothetical protein
MPAPLLPVAAVDLDHAHAAAGQVSGQSGAVAAGAFHADQVDRAEAAQPVQQPRITVRVGRELRHAEQPADRIQRGRDMHVGVGIHTAGDRTRLYHRHSSSLSMVEG